MINIEINYQTKVPQNFETLFERIAKVTFKKLRFKKFFLVSLVFVSSQKIKSLNKRYRGKDAATDVLSFPEVNEIIISYAKAKNQAKIKNNSLKKEVAWLFCHGLLHLLGFDHLRKEEERVMRLTEEEILKGV